MTRFFASCALGGALTLGACAETSGPDTFGYEGKPGFAFNVAPLTLNETTDGCYSFAVVSGLNQYVVGRGPSAIAANLAGVTGAPVTNTPADGICGSRFGQGAEVSYVAPCDASPGAEGHMVHLWIEDLCTSGSAATSDCVPNTTFQNPCGAAAGCALAVTCVENADTPVTFNFTIMDSAQQGFFDLAVNFDQIFCSAKLDTCYRTEGQPDQPIGMVFDTRVAVPVDPTDWYVCNAPAGCDDGFQTVPFGGRVFADLVANPDLGARMPSAVVALACTAGAGEEIATTLAMADIHIVCGPNGEHVTELSLVDVTQEGNQPSFYAADSYIGWAAYFGSEALVDQTTGETANKVYFNTAFAFDIATADAGCGIQWYASAFDANNPPDLDASANTYTGYGVIAFGEVDLADPDGMACQQNPLNGGGAVTTTYDYDPKDHRNVPTDVRNSFFDGTGPVQDGNGNAAPVGQQFLATDNVTLHALLTAVDATYGQLSGTEMVEVDKIRAWAAGVMAFAAAPEGEVPTFTADLTSPAVQAAFRYHLGAIYRAIAINPEGLTTVADTIPASWDGTAAVQDPHNAAARLGGFAALVEAMSSQTELIADLSQLAADQAGANGFATDPIVVMARAYLVGALLDAIVAQPEAGVAIQAALTALVGAAPNLGTAESAATAYLQGRLDDAVASQSEATEALVGAIQAMMGLSLTPTP